MATTFYPTLFQLNTRVWLTQRSEQLGRPATLDDITDADLDRIRAQGFEWVWLLSVWQTGEAGQHVSRTQEAWRKEFLETLPDLREADIAGSGFAITGYNAHPALGGSESLARVRARMAKRGLQLMLDFVPNHMALDHPWRQLFPDYFVQGTEDDLRNQPANYIRLGTATGDRIFAYGRDPYFSGWPDTLQLNYANPELAEAMTRELIHIADQCDGVRCDMAMLIVPEVFERTWGKKPRPFWTQAIRRVKDHHPGFLFMAEVYWDMEWELQQQGFDFTYDKRLYDRLRDGKSVPVHDHFCATLEFQLKLVRFLENHDEPRAAATFPFDQHEAAAVLSYFSPGLRFFHQGQMEGRLKRISPHLVRGPQEPVNPRLQNFYQKLLAVLNRPAFQTGRWTLLECVPAWGGNDSNHNYIAFSWEGGNQEHYIAAVNYAAERGQCFVRLPFADIGNTEWRLTDLLGDSSFDREGNDLSTRGLFLDERAWKYYLFELQPVRVRH